MKMTTKIRIAEVVFALAVLAAIATQLYITFNRHQQLERLEAACERPEAI